MAHCPPVCLGKVGGRLAVLDGEEQPRGWKRASVSNTPLALLLLGILPAEGSSEHTPVLPPHQASQLLPALGHTGFRHSAPGLGGLESILPRNQQPSQPLLTSLPQLDPLRPRLTTIAVGWMDRRPVGSTGAMETVPAAPCTCCTSLSGSPPLIVKRGQYNNRVSGCPPGLLVMRGIGRYPREGKRQCVTKRAFVASFLTPTPLTNTVGKAFWAPGAPLGLALGWALWTWPAQEKLCLMGLWARPAQPSLSFTKCPLCAQQGPKEVGGRLRGLCWDLEGSQSPSGSLHLGQGFPGVGACLARVPPRSAQHSKGPAQGSGHHSLY